MKVSAIIVTRGDADLGQVVGSLPAEWEVLVWNNGEDPFKKGGLYKRVTDSGLLARRVLGDGVFSDLSVYGRYAAIEYATHDLIYVQDDDCIVSNPEALVRAWMGSRNSCAEEQFDPSFLWHASPDEIKAIGRGEHVVCNMPPEFRYDFYRDHALVGFGACFHRDAPARAFRKAAEHLAGGGGLTGEHFYRTCDIVFTALTPRVLVDVPKTNLWWAEDASRMWRQPEHVEERTRMLELVRKVRDVR